MDQTVAPAPIFSSSPSAVQVVFQDYRPQFRRLVFRGALLELITVGFYRFWLATDIRRYLWRATSVDGDTLEYTGLAKELLFGALLALAIFAPVYLAYFLIGIEAERYQAFASVPLFLFFYLFSQFALYRARRYRMTRTIWRGVRFWMTGSGWDYAWRSGALMLLVVVTFGLALPWREAVLERFKMRHSYYGDLQGHFHATAWEFFKEGIWLWLSIPMILFASAFLGNTAMMVSKSVPVGISVQALFWLAMPFVYATYKAIQWRWWISGIRFGDVSFSSTIRARDFFGLYWKVMGWCLLILVFMTAAFSGVVTMAPGNTFLEKLAAVGDRWQFLLPIIFCYILSVLMVTAVMRIYLTHDVFQRLAGSTVIHNIETAENVSARGAAASAVGEGLADSLDVFGF